MADFLSRSDLEARCDAPTVLRMADRDGTGQWSEGNLAILNEILIEAEGAAYSRLMKGFPSKAQVIELMGADPFLKGQVAWMALELLSERQPGFNAADGWGAYRAQYERAAKTLDEVGKAVKRSAGEATAGANVRVGGRLQPRPPAGDADAFVFAPSRNNPRGSGGF